MEKETFGEGGFTLTVNSGVIRKIADQLVKKKVTPRIQMRGDHRR